MTDNTATTESIRELASKILSEKKVAVVIGYSRDPDAKLPTPVFVSNPEDVNQLVFDDLCFNNLSVYLSKDEVRSIGKIGVVLKGCDLRSVNVLLREHVVERDDLFLIVVRCVGVGDPVMDKCSVCEVHDPQNCDAVVGQPVEQPDIEKQEKYSAANKIEIKSIEERWEFWNSKLSACIRCYACRQVCPLCYCKQCIVDKTTPR